MMVSGLLFLDFLVLRKISKKPVKQGYKGVVYRVNDIVSHDIGIAKRTNK